LEAKISVAGFGHPADTTNFKYVSFCGGWCNIKAVANKTSSYQEMIIFILNE